MQFKSEGQASMGAAGRQGKGNLSDLLCVAIPKIAAGFAQLGISMVLLRAWGRESFGQISVCLSAIMLLDTVLGSAIDMSIFRLAPLWEEEDPKRARQVELAGLVSKPAAGLLLLPILLVSSSKLSAMLFQRDDLGHLLILTFAALLGILMVRSSQVHFQIRRKFRHYAATDTMHSVLRFGGAWVLLMTGQATPATVLGVFAAGSLIVTAVTLAGSAKAILQVEFSREVLSELLANLRLYLVTVVAGSVLGRMDLFILSARAQVSDAGLYAAAQLFAALPQLLGIYMAAVFSPRVLPLWRKGELGPVYRKYQAGLLGLAAVSLVGAIAVVNVFGEWLIPASYQPARALILLLLPAGLASMVAFPWAIPFLLYTRARTLLKVDCILLPALACAYWAVIPGYGVNGAAVLTSGVMVLRSLFFLVLANGVLNDDPGGERWSLANQSKTEMQMAGSAL